MLSFKHSGSLGDIIYSIPTILSLQRDNPGHEVCFYLNPGKPLNSGFDGFFLSTQSAQSLTPLLESQGFIVKIYNHEEVSVDLDEFRMIGLQYYRGHIPRWYFYLFKASFNLSNPWLNINAPKNDLIVVNRTKRYRNLEINYKFLKDPTFVGTKEEYEDFILDVPQAIYHPVNNFLELAQLISGAKLFIGNQSFCFALAEALKTPRVLETCPFAANVIPHGDNAWDCFNQNSFEFLCQK